jgi:hypothetical protein
LSVPAEFRVGTTKLTDGEDAMRLVLPQG